jgi:DNA polymerase III subunit gamma/tau
MTDTASKAGYRVLARKYRPGTFGTLIGQDAMVRTLSNAIDSGRLAHAFLLTGVRGVGKTSTARLIAKALNCVGVDGTGGPTMTPCDACDNCVSISQSRHMDVLEMDAATNSKVEQMRDLLDGVQYAPVSARFKIYIVDEVHMLSTSAFNALLKTLEEPPPHIKFILATTEIRKVPVTVLSRCQRFDLRRIPAQLLAEHFQHICTLEEVAVEPAALALIARAAEGSVRDGLSILDQAIAHGHNTVTAATVSDMLGLADRTAVLRLMDAILKGEPQKTLENLRAQYDLGADPATVVEDLLGLTHAITRCHVAGSVPDGSEEERAFLQNWSQALKPAAAHRLWQLLLKGLNDVNTAPSPIDAAEMVLLRIQHAAHMPDPADILARLQNGSIVAAGAPASENRGDSPRAQVTNVIAHPNAQPAKKTGIPGDFAAMVRLFFDNQEMVLAAALNDDTQLVSYAPGKLEIVPPKRSAPDFAARIRRCLETWTGSQWTIALSLEGGAQTLRATAEDTKAKLRETVLADPLVCAVMETFPGTSLTDIIPHEKSPDIRSAAL